MSRQARMERVVSARVATNMYQGCVINPITGMSSTPKPEESDNGSIIDELSDRNEKSSTEDNTEVVIEPKQEINSYEIAAEYELLKRPEERRSKRSSESVADCKVSDSSGDPFKVRTYLAVQDNFECAKSFLQEKKRSLTVKDKITTGNETRSRKGKTRKKLIKSKREKKHDKSDFDDNDEVVAGHQHLISEMKSMNGYRTSRYKSLLGELDHFLKFHESAVVDKGEKLNLEPSNVNMKEFHNWLDTVGKGMVDDNECIYKTTDYSDSCNVKKPIKVKPKKKKTNKQSEISPTSIQPTLEYKNVFPKQAWNEQMDASSQISFEEPVEVLDEKVFNSWRSTNVQHKEKETKVIRVMADKKHLVHDSATVLLDVE